MDKWSDLSPVISAFLNTRLRHVYSVYGRRVECTKMSVGTLRCADAFTEARGFLQVSEENRSQVSLCMMKVTTGMCVSSARQ